MFGAGPLVNLALALPTPDILQTLGAAVRNAGLLAIGFALLRRRVRARVPTA